MREEGSKIQFSWTLELPPIIMRYNILLKNIPIESSFKNILFLISNMVFYAFRCCEIMVQSLTKSALWTLLTHYWKGFKTMFFIKILLIFKGLSNGIGLIKKLHRPLNAIWRGFYSKIAFSGRCNFFTRPILFESPLKMGKFLIRNMVLKPFQ